MSGVSHFVESENAGFANISGAKPRIYEFTNWWEMRVFPIADFLGLMRGLAAPLNNPEDAKIPLTVEEREPTIRGIDALIKQCEECFLPFSADQLRRIRRALVEDKSTLAEVESFVPELMNRIEDESKRHVVMMIEPDHVQYAEGRPVF